MTTLGRVPAETGDMPELVQEYTALRRGALVFDRSARHRTRFSGAAARSTLTGLVTNDVQALADGAGQYAAALTVKGKIIADVRIFAQSDDLLVDVSPAAAPGWWAMIRKYVNPRVTPYRDVTAELGMLGVYGVRARELVASLCGRPAAELAALDMYAHLALDAPAGAFVARVPDLGLEGYDVLLPAAEVLPWMEQLRALGAVSGSAAAWTVARIEAGRGEWGSDMDENTLAQEANLEALNAISFTKGCYTGQETVARIHFRGHVNRTLRGLRFDAEHGAPGGSRLLDAQGREVGDVRSAAHSPRLGAIALGMIRREVSAGDPVTAVWDGGSAAATVQELPFPL